MAISASQITASQTLEEFRLEFNKLQTDVDSLQTSATFGTSITFEGATEDAFETTLTLVDPTADQTQTLQNKSGTLAIIGSDTTDSIILDGTDSSNSNAGSALLLDASADGVDVEDVILFEENTGDHLTNPAPIPEDDVLLESSTFGKSDFLLDERDGDKIEYQSATGDNLLGALFVPPASGGIQYTTPAADGISNQVLATDGAGNLQFVNQSTGLSIVSGDVNNRVLTTNGSTQAVGEGNLTFDGSTLAITGVATANTFEPGGDTSAGDNAAIGYTSAEGLILTGQGSTSDITFKNDADTTVFSIPTGTDDVLFPDSAKILLGDSSDLQLYHDGSSTSYVYAAAGNMYIMGTGTNSIIMQAKAGENSIIMTGDAAVQLYYDNSKKFETYSGGVIVTGAIDLNGALNVSSDVALSHDGVVTTYGADGEITLTHVADSGLALKHTASGDDKPITLVLQTGETDIAADDVLGKIEFQAPDEGTGTDAVLVAAGIAATSEGDFSATSNATKLSFRTAASEAATEKMSLSSAGNLTVSGTVTATAGSTLLIKNASGSTLKTVKGIS